MVDRRVSVSFFKAKIPPEKNTHTPTHLPGLRLACAGLKADSGPKPKAKAKPNPNPIPKANPNPNPKPNPAR